MTSTLTAPAADLLMVGPLLPELTADLESRYRVHRWWESPDRPRCCANTARRSAASPPAAALARRVR